MCGFAGFVGGDCSEVESQSVLHAMAKALRHRGPDDSGIWLESQHQVGLAHTRLSIHDLSPAGHQPMMSQSGRYIISFNGEIYNFKRLRKELVEVGHRFRGKSDTEVLLGCIECFGIKSALAMAMGMFAFALFDKTEHRLTLVRDRVGEKPLYYGWQQGTFIFGSELRALSTHPKWSGKLNRQGVSDLVAYNYIPDPESIYCGISKLQPGHLLELSLNSAPGEELVQSWWSLSDQVRSKAPKRYTGNGEAAITDLDQVLNQVISDQSMADVPTGVFLSGGIDSALTAAIMQKQSSRAIKTFTIGFSEVDFNEAHHAKRVAEYLGSDHHELVVSPEDVLDLVRNISDYYDEPFADTSQLPTVLLSKMTREKVTVALSGDGGDEIFGGYNRYIWGERLRGGVMSSVPLSIRAAVARGILSNSDATWERVFNLLRETLGVGKSLQVPADKLRKLAITLQTDSDSDLYQVLTRACPVGDSLTASCASNLVEKYQSLWDIAGSPAEKMMRLDTVTYLPGDILVKVDRASMAFGLEVRAPFLDVRVINFANSLPLEMKINGKTGKYILRQLLGRYMPRYLFERPKSGFAIPVGRWLRGPLREWGEELLSQARLREHGIFDEPLVRNMWNDHISGRKNNLTCLWGILIFQSWIKTYGATTT